MAAENFDMSLSFTLKEEGGFSDDPQDPGGATMDGITLAEFQSWFGSDKTVDDLKNISPSQLEMIYEESYWNQVRGDELPAGVDCSMFDFAVNAGPHEAIKVLQRELAVVVDGILGPITMGVLVRQMPMIVIDWLETGQLRFYRSLSTYRYFGKGWVNRTLARHAQSLALLPPAHAVKANRIV